MSWLLGQQLQKKDQQEYIKARVLTASPLRPKLQRHEGSSWPRARLRATQPIDMVYVAMRATVDSEIMALNATVEPMLIKDKTVEKRQVNISELTGTCHFGWT